MSVFGLCCKTFTVRTRAYVGDDELPAGAGFVVEMEREDGEVVRMPLRDARNVALVVKTLNIQRLEIFAADGEDSDELADIFTGCICLH